MNRRAIVSMHHKTGTKWMSQTFRAVSRDLGIDFHFFPARKQALGELVAPCIIVDRHAVWFTEEKRASEKLIGDRIFHLIRDPRDVVISGMHYHRKSEEPQLHKTRDEFGGLTYQQKINSLPDDHSRYLFEMDNTAGKTIRSMLAWDYSKLESFEVKYEDLIEDTETSLFAEISAHLGFSGDEITQCRDAFWRNSLFGTDVKKKSWKPDLKQTHVRSGRKRQWEKSFDKPLARAFLERFPDALVKLGYERDNAWINALPEQCVDASPAASG